jgi:hypothetical protein
VARTAATGTAYTDNSVGTAPAANYCSSAEIPTAPELAAAGPDADPMFYAPALPPGANAQAAENAPMAARGPSAGFFYAPAAAPGPSGGLFYAPAPAQGPQNPRAAVLPLQAGAPEMTLGFRRSVLGGLRDTDDTPEKPALAPEGLALAEMGPALSPEGSVLPPEGPALSAEGSALSPEGTALSPGGPALFPEGPALSPEGSALSPEGSIPSPSLPPYTGTYPHEPALSFLLLSVVHVRWICTFGDRPGLMKMSKLLNARVPVPDICIKLGPRWELCL